jgi:hypothetical protein
VVTEQSLLTTIGTDMQQLTKKGMKNGFVALMAVLTRYRFRCIVHDDDIIPKHGSDTYA